MRAPQFILTVSAEGFPDQRIPLRPGQLIIGRATECDLMLQDPGISRKHAQLLVTHQNTITVEDLGSGNGTFLDGAEVTEARYFRPGQVLEVGIFFLALEDSLADRSSVKSFLRIADGEARREHILELTGETYDIGRSMDCDIILTDPAASRVHCTLKRQGEQWSVLDSGSSNGIYVNGHLSAMRQLHHGDQIVLGDSCLTFELDPPPPEPPPPPAPEAEAPLPEPQATPIVDEAPRLPVAPVPPQRPTTAGSWLTVAALAVAALATIISLALVVVVLTLNKREAHVLTTLPPATAPHWTFGDATPLPVEEINSEIQKGQAAYQGPPPQPIAGLKHFERVLRADPGNHTARVWSFGASEWFVTQAIASADPKIPADSPDASRVEPFDITPALDAWAGGERQRALELLSSTPSDQPIDPRAQRLRNAIQQELVLEVAAEWRAGMYARIRGDKESAIGHFEQVLSVYPSHPSAQMELARLKGTP